MTTVAAAEAQVEVRECAKACHSTIQQRGVECMPPLPQKCICRVAVLVMQGAWWQHKNANAAGQRQ